MQSVSGLFGHKNSNGSKATTPVQAETVSVVHHHESDRTSFAKHLRWKMKTTEVELLTITPDMAAEMLVYNTSNRPCSKNVVSKYARQMKAGEWRLTREMLLLSPDRLIQGQHRLNACIQAGAPFRAYVAFGEPDENFSFVDIGKPRGPADIFAIHGVLNYSAVASATRWLMAYEIGQVSNEKTGHTGNPTPDELYQFYLQHRRIHDSKAVLSAFHESKLAPPSLMLAMHYICSRKNRVQADEFFLQVGSGVGIAGKSSAAFKLRKRLIDNHGSASGKLSPLVIAAYTIKAWNALRANRPVGILKWRGDGAPNEAFPRAQ